MTPFVDKLVEVATAEWAFFGFSTRALNDQWAIGGDEQDAPYRQRVQQYWSVVGHPTWDGTTPQPWSGAFISWCFETAGAGNLFEGSAKHSVYVDWIRRDKDGPGFDLADPASATVAPGDLIWNSRRDNTTSDAPKNHVEAIKRLKQGDMFISHVDIVVAVRAGQCDSIGGNVSDASPGGSVTKSTWRLDGSGHIADPRKSWIGIVKTRL